MPPASKAVLNLNIGISPAMRILRLRINLRAALSDLVAAVFRGISGGPAYRLTAKTAKLEKVVERHPAALLHPPRHSRLSAQALA
jgi:hypothetical protein